MRRVSLWLLLGCVGGGAIFYACALRWVNWHLAQPRTRTSDGLASAVDYFANVAPYFGGVIGATFGAAVALLILICREEEHRERR